MHVHAADSSPRLACRVSAKRSIGERPHFPVVRQLKLFVLPSVN